MLCDYELEIKYPLTITNCLPTNLSYKLTRMNETLLNEADNMSKMSLSRVGDELYSKYFNTKDTIQTEGVIQRVSKEKVLGISPENYPLLTIESEQLKSRSFIKLQKYVSKVGPADRRKRSARREAP